MPNVSLMNYTYIAESPYASSPVIIMTTNRSSKKTNNLVANPSVSLLVHDCAYPSFRHPIFDPHTSLSPTHPLSQPPKDTPS